jgi:four helix bundle protein
MATVKHYRELVCWQLSVELRSGLIAITDRPRVRRNLKFCDQVGDSTRSAPANIAEGFNRSNREFMRYLDIALGSLQETENHVDEALERKYLTPEEHLRFRTLAKRAIRAAEELKAYLRRRTERRQPNQPDQPSST